MSTSQSCNQNPTKVEDKLQSIIRQGNREAHRRRVLEQYSVTLGLPQMETYWVTSKHPSGSDHLRVWEPLARAPFREPQSLLHVVAGVAKEWDGSWV